jgi:hypothetical protein
VLPLYVRSQPGIKKQNRCLATRGNQKNFPLSVQVTGILTVSLTTIHKVLDRTFGCDDLQCVLLPRGSSVNVVYVLLPTTVCPNYFCSDGIFLRSARQNLQFCKPTNKKFQPISINMSPMPGSKYVWQLDFQKIF